MALIDGFKATTQILDIEEWKRSTGIELHTSINTVSGEQIKTRRRVYDNGTTSFKYWSRYGTYNLGVIESLTNGKSLWRLNLRGSLYTNSGNWLSYDWLKMQQQLIKIRDDLKIPLDQWHITNFEYFTDIPYFEPAIDLLSNSVMLYQNKVFTPFDPDRQGRVIGYVRNGVKHAIKTYDKALQKGLCQPLLRIEDHVKKMQYMAGHEVSTLQEFTNPWILFGLRDKLVKLWDQTSLFDTRIILKAYGSDKTKLIEYALPSYWDKAKLTENGKRYHTSKLNELKLKYDDTAHSRIRQLIFQSNNVIVPIVIKPENTQCYANALQSHFK